MKEPSVVKASKLVEEPYASILCYPRASRAEGNRRVKELQKLGVKVIEFIGEKEAFNMHVLGKGCVGIVVLARMNNEKVALKIRRVDADRSRMQREADLLRRANSMNVGPRLHSVSRNFLLMQHVEGVLLPAWLEKTKAKRQIRTVLREVLEQCWRLDGIGLDHGELSYAPKHLIVGSGYKPFIVDFESASLARKSSNVTSICQFLFISSEMSKRITEKLGKKDKRMIVEVLRRYKKAKTRESFESVLAVCGL